MAGVAGEASEPIGADDLDEGFDDGADAEGAATPGAADDARDASPQSVLDLVPPPPREAAAGISWTGLAPAEPSAPAAPLTAEPDAAAPETVVPADTAAAPEAAPDTARPAATEPTRVVWSSSPTSYGPSSSGSSRRDDY